MKNKNINCPICHSTTKLKENIDKNIIKNTLIKYFDSEINENLDLINYDIYKCKVCTYEFAYPFTEGSNKFYTWITKQKKYYPYIRWEYKKVLNYINENNISSVMDIGCGDGNFLKYVKDNNSIINLFGIDTTENSIKNCKNKGLINTYCETVESFINKNSKKFEVVCLFHVLEHISKPYEFIVQLKELLEKNGKIFISTPYSPMDFEYYWFDILNKPPHHMGFWNENSYKQLAKILNMNIKIHMEPTQSFKISYLNALNLTINGNSSLKSINKFKIISNIFIAVKLLVKLYFRKKLNGERASNVILISLENK